MCVCVCVCVRVCVCVTPTISEKAERLCSRCSRNVSLTARALPQTHRRGAGYANRNSLQYIETYGLEGIDTMLRGTIRYKGYCEVVDAFRKLGLLDKVFSRETAAAVFGD